MSKPELVLLHGVGLDRTMWQPVIGALETEFTVRTLNLLGHGSREAAWDGITLADLADDIGWQLSPATHLVGFSLGALVAQYLARYRPELVASLTSVSSVCQRTDAERDLVLTRLATAESDFPASVAASLRRWFPSDSLDVRLNPESASEVESILLSNDVPSYLNSYRVFATADAEIGPELARISAPSLAITGELDSGSTPEMTRRLAAAIPNCSAVVVSECRHMLPIERPVEFTAAVTTFLREHS